MTMNHVRVQREDEAQAGLLAGEARVLEETAATLTSDFASSCVFSVDELMIWPNDKNVHVRVD